MTITKTFIACASLALMYLFSGITSAQTPSDSNQVQSWKSLLIAEARTIRLRMAASQERVASLEVELQKNHRQTEASNVSDLAFEDVFRMLHLQNAELSIDLGGLTARLDLLKEQVEKKRADKMNLTSLEIEAAQIQVELTQQRLQTVGRLAAKGARSDGELLTSKHEAEVAKLQLRRAEEMLKQDPSSIVDAVFETALEIAEKKARLEAVTKMLNGHRNAREAVSRVTELKQEMNLERTTLRELRTKLRSVELQLSRSENEKQEY